MPTSLDGPQLLTSLPPSPEHPPPQHLPALFFLPWNFPPPPCCPPPFIHVNLYSSLLASSLLSSLSLSLVYQPVSLSCSHPSAIHFLFLPSSSLPPSLPLLFHTPSVDSDYIFSIPYCSSRTDRLPLQLQVHTGPGASGCDVSQRGPVCCVGPDCTQPGLDALVSVL